MPPKRHLSPSLSHDYESPIYVSKPIEDRASTFTGYFSPTIPHRQLQSLSSIADASHRILAWRKLSSQKTISGIPNYHTGFDDDGESYAGKRLMKLLDDYKVEGAVVVARYYGGVLLGPARFVHIESVAKEVIRAYLADKSGETGKKRRLEDEKERIDLVEELQRRDESISVLRKLLDDKMGKTMKEEEGPSKSGNGEVESKKSKPVPTVDYDGMSMERLKQMDKVRDKTIEFLLKKIDEVESKTEEDENGSASSLRGTIKNDNDG